MLPNKSEYVYSSMLLRSMDRRKHFIFLLGYVIYDRCCILRIDIIMKTLYSNADPRIVKLTHTTLSLKKVNVIHTNNYIFDRLIKIIIFKIS